MEIVSLAGTRIAEIELVIGICRVFVSRTDQDKQMVNDSFLVLRGLTACRISNKLGLYLQMKQTMAESPTHALYVERNISRCGIGGEYSDPNAY